MQENKILAIIPARGGSKGVHRKNIADVNGRPLIAYTIEAALHSRYISKVVVSSEDGEILEISQKLGADILKRPEELATDIAPCEPLISNVLSQLKETGEMFDMFALLQPTSPLRDSSDIDSAFTSLMDRKAEALISVYEPSHSPLKAFVLNNKGLLKGVLDNKAPFRCRQELPKCYYPNGAIFIIYTNIFLENKSLLADRTIPYVMPEERSMDVDTPEDLEKISEYLRKRNAAPGDKK
ncbi:MAG: acylneuraminate cytidylyltransferase family protein [Proteobacteria bacterium]|nr:acylneuraminate cytidylyltransferase family protein [Pseudomonadota bacterium]